MDERTKELIAIGASAAVNCHPCLQHHLTECDRLGIDRAEAKAAIEVGMMVNRGAAVRTKDHVQVLLGTDVRQLGGESGCCGS
jgi:AhpD family alkylhydroperoxidase